MNKFFVVMSVVLLLGACSTQKHRHIASSGDRAADAFEIFVQDRNSALNKAVSAELGTADYAFSNQPPQLVFLCEYGNENGYCTPDSKWSAHVVVFTVYTSEKRPVGPGSEEMETWDRPHFFTATLKGSGDYVGFSHDPDVAPYYHVEAVNLVARKGIGDR